MYYRKHKPSPSVRLALDRQFPSIELGDGILINGIKGFWTAERGYFVRFKILIPLPEGGQINVTNCILEALDGGILRWSTPRSFGSPFLETNSAFYERVMAGFRTQGWISLIGSSRLRGRDIKLPAEDPLAKALEAASKAL